MWTAGGLESGAKNRPLKESWLYLFCIKHPVETECFGKGTDAKPASKVAKCKGRHAEELHKLPAEGTPSVNTMEYKEEDDEAEGYVNALNTVGRLGW